MVNQKLISQFKNILRKDKLKLTPQRVMVFEEVIQGDSHRECENIYLALKQNEKHISRATVYRTMDILVRHNFARKMELGDGRVRYESKMGSPHHDHLICTSCGKIIEFVNQNIEDIQDEIAKQHHFKLQNHIHQLFGFCKKCH